MLAAADELFASADSPASVTMDDVARAAGVGKGTLFRAFEDRAGLIRAIWHARYEPLRQAIAAGTPPFDDATPPRERIAALADAIVEVKLNNRHLAVALEHSGPDPMTSPAYESAHRLLLQWLLQDARERRRRPDRATVSWTAHAILAFLRADLLNHLVVHGATARTLRRNVRATVATLTDAT